MNMNLVQELQQAISLRNTLTLGKFRMIKEINTGIIFITRAENHETKPGRYITRSCKYE